MVKHLYDSEHINKMSLSPWVTNMEFYKSEYIFSTRLKIIERC